MEWSLPKGGAPVIKYVLHYNGSDGSVQTENTNVNIHGIKNNHIYTITVEARSLNLSGESEPMPYESGKSIPHYFKNIICPHFTKVHLQIHQ